MKSVLLSVRPQHVANILNGIKTLEIRKRFPKDYVGWVYIYMCQDHKRDWYYCKEFGCYFKDVHDHDVSFEAFKDLRPLNAKVVARFWCDKVEEINKIIMYNRPFDLFETKTLQPSELLKQSCLRAEEMTKYFMFSNLPKESAAIHITKLDIFDKPKEISEFRVFPKVKSIKTDEDFYLFTYGKPLTRAPESWQYIEV